MKRKIIVRFEFRNKGLWGKIKSLFDYYHTKEFDTKLDDIELNYKISRAINKVLLK